MPVTVDRIIKQRHLSCMVAVDTIDHIAQRTFCKGSTHVACTHAECSVSW